MLDKFLIDKIKNGAPFYEPQVIHNLFSWAELEKVINITPLINDKRFHFINGNKHLWYPSYWQTDITSWPTEIIKEELRHYVCYIHDASRYNSNINKLASELEQINNFPTDAHIYFALTTHKQGFDIHNDRSHNFIVQVEGETNFKVWDEPADIREYKDIINLKPFIDVTMKAGDIIYVPKGYWHQAISKTKRLSISFPSAVVKEAKLQNRDWISLQDYL